MTQACSDSMCASLFTLNVVDSGFAQEPDKTQATQA